MTLRIGNGAGFWGDWLDAPCRLAESGNLDYLTLEYLAELTMSMLAHQKSRNPQAGYVTDLPAVVRDVAPQLRSGLKIITNGGGMNPDGAARAVSKMLVECGLDDVRVALCWGDDIAPRLDELTVAGETFSNFDSGESFENVRGNILSANAYLGASAIVQALEQDAQIVITGRVADASLTVGPAIFEYGWKWDDWERLAAATVAGHLIECGAQMTGGMYSRWTPALSLTDVGYPIAEIDADGNVVVTKPDGSGGEVSVASVSEQLVYEIGDPARYLTPDVTANFQHIVLAQEGRDRVRVSGAQGTPPPDSYKVSMSYEDGYYYAGTLVLTGRDAGRAALACAEAIFGRLKSAGIVLERTHVERLGTGDVLPGLRLVADRSAAGPSPFEEVVLRISAFDKKREHLERLAREMAPLVTSGPPGVTGYAGARPKPYRGLAYWPTTVSRDRVSHSLEVLSAGDWVA